MDPSLVECVPNVSEGRRPHVIEAVADAVRRVPGVAVLHLTSDQAHNRTVLTCAGPGESVQAAVLAMFDVAVATIDLRNHRGVHPRMGAVDVVPFVPIGCTMDACVTLARSVGASVASRFAVPVYLYEAAATSPDRRDLAAVRRGQFEGLREKMRDPRWRPDYGPSEPHPTAGACAIGARHLLIAYNVNLSTDRLDVARAIAASVRERNGGFRGVKALGLPLADRGIVQVSMNLTDYRRTPIPPVFEAIATAAAGYGVEVLESEIIGLVPAAALAGSTPEALKLRGFSASQLLEDALRNAGIGT
jgi:glutamate formiminotransferase